MKDQRSLLPVETEGSLGWSCAHCDQVRREKEGESSSNHLDYSLMKIRIVIEVAMLIGNNEQYQHFLTLQLASEQFTTLESLDLLPCFLQLPLSHRWYISIFTLMDTQMNVEEHQLSCDQLRLSDLMHCMSVL